MSVHATGGPDRRWLRVLAACAWVFTGANLLVNLVALRHACPLSIYPAVTAFVLSWHVATGERPARRPLVIFCCAWTALTVILGTWTSLTGDAGVVDPSLFLEPAFVSPPAIIVLGIHRVAPASRYPWRVLVVVGAVLLVLAGWLMLPGNPIVEFLANPPGGYHDLLDARVPAGTALSIFMFYHVAVIWVPASSAAVFFGLAIIALRIEVRGDALLAIAIAIPLSLVVAGVPVAWLALEPARTRA